MSNNLGSLVVSLGLDAAEFTRGLRKSEYETKQWLRSLETGIEATRTVAFAAFAAMGTAVAVLDRQLNEMAGFQDLADKMGDTAEQVASLKLAADVSGVSLDAVSSASVKLTTALSKTDDESKGASLGLKAIGIEVESFKSLSPVAQFDAVSQALAGFEDGAGKTAVAVQLFGKSGAELIPILNDLAEQGGRHVTLTAEQIRAADDYSKATARLRSELQTMVQITAADAAPIMSEMIQMLRDTVQYSTGAADGIDLLGLALGGVRNTLQTVLVVGSDVAFVLKTLFATADAYANISEKLIRLDIDGAKAIGAAYREMSAERRKALDDYQRRILNPVRYSADDQSIAEARRLGLTTAPKKLSSDLEDWLAFQKYLDSLKNRSGGKIGAGLKDAGFTGLTYDEQITQRVGKLFEDSAVIKAKEYADVLSKIDSLYFDGAISGELYESSMLKLTGATEKGTAQATRFIEEQKRLAELLSATESAGIDQQRQDMELLARAFTDNVISEQQYLEAVTARLNLVADKTGQVKSLAEELGLTFTSAFEDAIVSGKGLGDVIRGLEQDILRLVTRKLVTEPLGNALTSAFSGFNLGSLFSFDGGGYTGTGGRSGGLDGKGGFLAMLHPNETVLDHTRGQGGGGVSHTYQISVSMPQGATRATAQQFGREISRQLAVANARNG